MAWPSKWLKPDKNVWANIVNVWETINETISQQLVIRQDFE